MAVEPIRRSQVLLVEDEQPIADTILYALESEGFAASHVLLAQDALALLRAGTFDIVLLDIGLPDRSGFDVCRELRQFSSVPVIFLSARAGEIDRVVGLELGADDYVVKPFSPRELIARVRAHLRRSSLAATAGAAVVLPASACQPVPKQNPLFRPASALVHVGDFEHDGEAMRISYSGQVLMLTRYEYQLLASLLRRPGAIFTRAQLMDDIWADALDSNDRTVDTHIKTLRAKLRAIRADRDPIATHRGLGYSLEIR